jgi:hypothetical protein
VKTDVCIEVCRTVFEGTRWFLFEHGTIFCARVEVGDKYAIAQMKDLAAKLGPYSGEGSEWGDCNPMKLNNFPGWLVSFPALGSLVTYVGPEEMKTAPPPSSTEKFIGPDGKIMPITHELRVALFGRYKRNLDARSPKIIKRSTGDA